MLFWKLKCCIILEIHMIAVSFSWKCNTNCAVSPPTFKKHNDHTLKKMLTHSCLVMGMSSRAIDPGQSDMVWRWGYKQSPAALMCGVREEKGMCFWDLGSVGIHMGLCGWMSVLHPWSGIIHSRNSTGNLNYYVTRAVCFASIWYGVLLGANLRSKPTSSKGRWIGLLQ